MRFSYRTKNKHVNSDGTSPFFELSKDSKVKWTSPENQLSMVGGYCWGIEPRMPSTLTRSH